MSLLTMITPQQTKKINWQGALGLWNIATFKIAGLTISEVFLAQASDTDLKFVLNHGKEKLIIPHIEKIQKLMENEGITAPSVPNRKTLKSIEKILEPNDMITDNEIAIDIYTLMKEGLRIDLEGTTDPARPDVRKLAWDILNEDFKAYENLATLFIKKNWIQTPPSV